jgi:hypothetical protein
MEFFCMVVLDVSIFNCFSHFSGNVMFGFHGSGSFPATSFSIADLLRHFWDEEESLLLRTGEVCCC